MAAGQAWYVRQRAPPRACTRAVAGGFLPSAQPALIAATDTTVALLVASAGAQDGEGQVEVVCEQPVFAAVRAVAALPAGAADEQDLLALLTDSGFLSILRFDAALARFVAVQQLPLPPEPPGDPFRLLAVHPSGAAVAVGSLLGSVCMAVRQPSVPPAGAGSPGVVAPVGRSSAAGPFSSPVALKLAHNLWSLAFAGPSLAEAPAAAASAQAGAAAATSAATAVAAAAAAAQHVSLVALHEHPLSGAFAAAEYLCPVPTAAAGATRQLGSAAPQLTAFIPLEDAAPSGGGGSGSGSQPGSPTSRSGAGPPQLGQPRALLQLPPAAEGWHPGAQLVLREGGVQLISGSTQPALEPVAEAAERWWRQQERQAAATAVQLGAAAEAAPEEASRPQPMAVSLEQQPSVEQQLRRRRHGSLDQLPDAWEERSEGEDEEMLEAAGSEAAASAAAEAAVEAAGAASPSARSAAGATVKGAAAAAAASSSGCFITSCCWEWPAPAAAQLAERQPVLVCALEDGRLWRLPLPSPAEFPSSGSCMLACPSPDAGSEQQRQQPPPRTVLASRSLAALPGGLLCACTDCSGLQLLQLSPSGTYEPLLPPLAAAQQGASGWDASIAAAACTLPAAGAVADCVMADLEGGGQAQLYAACCGTASSGGRLCVLYPDPKPDTVFELPGAAEGITGLWGLRQRSADKHHSLALLSFLGGSRLLAVQGGIFRDVTDCYPLHASAQTLAAGNLRGPSAAGAAGVAAQVTSHAVVLFGTQPSSGPSRQASGALFAPATAVSSSDASSGSDDGAQPAWQPPTGCSIGAAVVAEDAVLLFCTGSSRQLVVLLPAPPAAVADGSESDGQACLPQLVTAAHMPLQGDVSCISNLLEPAGAVASYQQPEQQQQPGQQRSAVFAVGTYASTVLLVQLSWQPQSAAARLSLLQSLDLTASSIAGSVSTAAAAAAAADSTVPFSPRAFQREQLTPESLLVLPASGAAEGSSTEVAAGSAAAASAASSAAAGSAASLVVGLRTGSLLQMRCSWVPQQAQQEELLAVSLGHMPAVLLPLPAQPSLATAAAGVPPPAAAALSDRVSLLHCPASAAVCGGRLRCMPLALPQVQVAAPLLLESDILSNSTCALPEASWGVSEATLEPAGGSGSPAVLQPPAQQLQLFLLCAAADSCLRMVSLDPQQAVASRCWPLPHDLQPSRLVAHAASGCVAVAGASTSLPGRQQRRHRFPWEAEEGWQEEDEEEAGPMAAVQLLDPATGDLMATYTGFLPDERITAMTVWDPSQPAPLLPAPASLGDKIEAAAATAAAAAAPEAGLGRRQEAGGAALQSHPIVGSPEQVSPPDSRAARLTDEAAPAAPAEAEAAAAAAGAAAGGGSKDETPWGGFIVVGTTVGYGEPPGDANARWGGAPQGPPSWDDESSQRLQGRLLLLQVATATAASAGASGGGGAAPAAAAATAAGGGLDQVQPEEQTPRRRLQLLAVAEMHLPNRVLALCPGSTQVIGGHTSSSSSSSGSSSGSQEAAEPRLFAAVGRRLVSLEWRARQQMLRRMAWVPTARPITSLQVSDGLLAAADRREGVTLYRYYEPHPTASAPPPHPEQRGRLARRYRLAPPAAGELRHRLGLALHQHIREGIAGDGKTHGVAGQGSQLEEELGPGFTVAAADSCCRPAVGALVVPAAPADGSSSSSREAAPAVAAAVLDARGEVRMLQQAWPGRQPALQQRCRLLLREPAMALLPGSLGYQGGAAGGGTPFDAAAAAGAAGEMAAVTLGGSVLSLQPLDQPDAAQLAALQRVLASHPATAPLSGSSHAAYRGWAAGRAAVPLTFSHPLPAGAKAGGADADLLPPHSPSAAAAGAQQGALGSALAPVALEPAAPEADWGPVVAAQPAAGSPPRAAAGAAAAAQPVDAILDAELLQQFLLLPPAEQRAVVAGMGGSGAAARGQLGAIELRRAAQRLNNLVASLLL